MDIANFLHNLIEFDPGALSLLFFVFGILTLTVYIKRISNGKVSKIQESKKEKTELLDLLINTLSTLSEMNNKLIKENEITEAFNEKTVLEAITVGENYNNIKEKLSILENKNLEDEINFYFNGQISMLHELSKIETEAYTFQREYQQKVAYYTREFENFKLQERGKEFLHDYRERINKDLDDIRNVVIETINKMNVKRNEFQKELTYSNTLLDKLLLNVKTYKQNVVETKKFYPKYLAFA